jgi:glutamate racemase
VGILATKGTLSSELFHKTVAGFSGINFIEQVGFNLVTLIESGKINSRK